jgi:peptidylprolyl isomerase
MSMRRIAIVPALTLVAAMQAATPPGPPKTPSEVIAASKPAEWAEIPAEELMVVDLKSGSRVVIQLAPAFAPVHVANIQKLARGGYWQGAAI